MKVQLQFKLADLAGLKLEAEIAAPFADFSRGRKIIIKANMYFTVQSPLLPAHHVRM